MKITLDLPDELVRTIKVRAARDNRKLKDVVTELLQRGLEAQPADHTSRRAGLPLVQCAHAASPENEITPQRAAEILLGHDVDGLHT